MLTVGNAIDWSAVFRRSLRNEAKTDASMPSSGTYPGTLLPRTIGHQYYHIGSARRIHCFVLFTRGCALSLTRATMIEHSLCHVRSTDSVSPFLSVSRACFPCDCCRNLASPRTIESEAAMSTSTEDSHWWYFGPKAPMNTGFLGGCGVLRP